MKVYVLIESWAVEEGETGTTVTLYKSKKEVIKALKQLQAAIIKDCTQYDIHEESSNGFSNYVEGEYMYEHTDIWYEEKEIIE